MPLQTIKGGVWLPNRPPHLAASFLPTSLQIDANGEKVAFIVQAPKSGTVVKLCFWVFTVTTGNTIDVRLETVDASGNPSGTLWDSPTNNARATANITAAGWYAVTLNSSQTVAQGDYMAIVLAHTGNSANLTISTVDPTSCAQEFPYSAQYIASWTKLKNCPICAIEYPSTTYEVIQGAWPINGYGNVAFNNTGTNERGLRVKLPYPTRAVGAWVWADLDGDTELRLYDVDDLVNYVARVVIDKDARQTTTQGRQVYYFTSAAPLSPQHEYFLMLHPTTATNVTLTHVDVLGTTPPLLDAMDGGKEIYYADRAGTGSFTPNTTRRPMMGLILDQFSDENLGYFDVTAFGAAGDGVTDDTAKITATFTAANSAGAGSTVFFPLGTYICEGLDLTGSGLHITGDGTLKLKNASAANQVLKISGDNNDVSSIRIDGNSGGGHSGLANGLYVTGKYNHVRIVSVFNTKATTGTADFLIGGSHNVVEDTWSTDAGGAAYRDTGDYNQYVRIMAKNWGYSGFYRPGVAVNRIDIDGGFFEPGLASADNNCIWFDGANSAKMVVVRNVVVDWPSTLAPSGTPLLGKFGYIDWLVLDNCMFRHEQVPITTVEVGTNVKRVSIDHTFMSRRLDVSLMPTDAYVVLNDTQVGDDALWLVTDTRPDTSVVGIRNANFVARSCRFMNYKVAALELKADISTAAFLHLEASDTKFSGRGDLGFTTYDLTLGVGGAVNASRKILWLNNRRENTGPGTLSDIFTPANKTVYFKTRDWSKQVYEWSAKPTIGAGFTWSPGDLAFNTTPASGGKIGWVYVGSPTNDWKDFGPIS